MIAAPVDNTADGVILTISHDAASKLAERLNSIRWGVSRARKYLNANLGLFTAAALGGDGAHVDALKYAESVLWSFMGTDNVEPAALIAEWPSIFRRLLSSRIRRFESHAEFIHDLLMPMNSEVFRAANLHNAADETTNAETSDQPQPETENNDFVHLVGQIDSVMLDENGVRILAIGNDRSRSSDQRMREICDIDSRFSGKQSVEWSSLLGVTEQAIRKTPFWKELRSRMTAKGE